MYMADFMFYKKKLIPQYAIMARPQNHIRHYGR